MRVYMRYGVTNRVSISEVLSSAVTGLPIRAVPGITEGRSSGQMVTFVNSKLWNVPVPFSLCLFSTNP